MRLIGYVSKDGHFFRFDRDGRRQLVAVESLERGLARFFDVSAGGQVRLVDVVPEP